MEEKDCDNCGGENTMLLGTFKPDNGSIKSRFWFCKACGITEDEE